MPANYAASRLKSLATEVDRRLLSQPRSSTRNNSMMDVDGVEGPQHRLAVAIERLAEAGAANLFDRALRGANLAPVAGGENRIVGCLFAQ